MIDVRVDSVESINPQDGNIGTSYDLSGSNGVFNHPSAGTRAMQYGRSTSAIPYATATLVGGSRCAPLQNSHHHLASGTIPNPQAYMIQPATSGDSCTRRDASVVNPQRQSPPGTGMLEKRESLFFDFINVDFFSFTCRVLVKKSLHKENAKLLLICQCNIFKLATIGLLRPILPPPELHTHNLRKRSHSLVWPKRDKFTELNFLRRMLFL